jgi:hypothetical protein
MTEAPADLAAQPPLVGEASLEPASGFIADEGEAVLGIGPIAFRLGKRESLLRGFPNKKERILLWILKRLSRFPNWSAYASVWIKPAHRWGILVIAVVLHLRRGEYE